MSERQKTILYVEELQSDLKDMCQKIENYNDILNIGDFWGKYIYSCFKI